MTLQVHWWLCRIKPGLKWSSHTMKVTLPIDVCTEYLEVHTEGEQGPQML